MLKELFNFYLNFQNTFNYYTSPFIKSHIRIWVNLKVIIAIIILRILRQVC